MKIAILGGTGSIGKGLALRWARKHEIVACSRDPDKAMKSQANVIPCFRIKDGSAPASADL